MFTNEAAGNNSFICRSRCFYRVPLVSRANAKARGPMDDHTPFFGPQLVAQKLLTGV